MSFEDFSEGTRRWQAGGRHETIDARRIFIFECGRKRATRRVAIQMARPRRSCSCTAYPTSCHDWRGVAERLAVRHHTIAPDFLGFGLSDKPEAFGYSLFQQSDMVEGLLRQLGVGAAHVVSHDMGTSVHCELLARQAERRLGFELRTSTFLNGSMLQWMAKITPFQELLASNATLPQAIDICRTVMPGVYVDAPPRIDAEARCDYARRRASNGRPAALPRGARAAAGPGRLYA